MMEKKPDIDEMAKIDLMIKRIHATLAIEGNSLTEEQVREIYFEMHPELRNGENKTSLND